MSILLSAAQMRAVEDAAISSGEVTGLELMERAGQAVVEAILARIPQRNRPPRRGVILCGPGNNGGDGFVIARLLQQRGWDIELRLHGDPARLPIDAKVNHDRWRALGAVLPFDDFDPFQHPCDLAVDALLGTGLSRPVAGPMAGVLEKTRTAVAQSLDLSVALDLPSGLCADSGRLLGQAPEVDLTVSFGFFKRGHFLAQGPANCGALICADIGLDSEAPHRLFRRERGGETRRPDDDNALIRLETGESVRPGFSGPPGRLDKGWLDQRGHKFDHGHALILSGPTGRGGAARLSARAALRIGAGLVTLACPPDAMAENAARLDAIMLHAVADAGDLTALLADPRITALCLGPGFGTGPDKAALLQTALASARPIVLDADALTLLAGDAALFPALHPKSVLTPHGGEFARLFPDIAARLSASPQTGPAYSRIDAAREAASRAGCTIVLKGQDTVIAGPEGYAFVNAAAYGREAPWLATAGSGDVLAGIITGLLARGLQTGEACRIGAWLHVEAARSFGPGLIAEDLPEALPKVLRTIDHWPGPRETAPLAGFSMPPAGVFPRG